MISFKVFKILAMIPFLLFCQAQELLSHIAVLEVTVSKLEQEMVSLHFQLSQERNERRLAEYHLRRKPSSKICMSSSNIEKIQVTELFM